MQTQSHSGGSLLLCVHWKVTVYFHGLLTLHGVPSLNLSVENVHPCLRENHPFPSRRTEPTSQKRENLCSAYGRGRRDDCNRVSARTRYELR